MANISFDYYNGETNYSDGSIEDELLDIVQNHNDFEELVEHDGRWPIFYHLSYLRQNILNWYEFKKDASVLEVGAGCGAITPLLCEKCKSVVAVELTKRRAMINFERNKKYCNLDIYAGDISSMQFDEQFDYITLIGVFEYAAMIGESENPHADMLINLKKMLKPGGHIIIAIENRFGLKYFSGAREDHTGGLFDGINGYPGDSKIKTFTKKELEELLASVGMKQYVFYYPLPDYKFPKMILTDESINSQEKFIDLSPYDSDRLELFNEFNVMQQLGTEGVLSTFSNSFLVDVGASETKVLLARLSNERKKEYRIISALKKEGDAIIPLKIPITKESAKHLEKLVNIFSNQKKINGFDIIPYKMMKGNIVCSEYIKGQSLFYKLCDFLSNNDKESIFITIDMFYKTLVNDTYLTNEFYSEEFKEVFGAAKLAQSLNCASTVNLDFNFDNIIISDNKPVLLDYEWFFNFAIPLDYVFWRATSAFFSLFNSNKLMDELKVKYGISDEMERVFLSWEKSFRLYVGYTDFSRIVKKKYNLDSNIDLFNNQNMFFSSSIYFDLGEGFNEEDIFTSENHKFGDIAEFKVVFDRNKYLPISLRFDPLEGKACKCRILSIESNVSLSANIVNCFSKNNGEEIFLDMDPIYLLTGDFNNLEWLTIKYSINLLKPIQIQQLMQENIAELDLMKEKFEAIVQSRSWRAVMKLRKLKSFIFRR